MHFCQVKKKKYINKVLSEDCCVRQCSFCVWWCEAATVDIPASKFPKVAIQIYYFPPTRKPTCTTTGD